MVKAIGYGTPNDAVASRQSAIPPDARPRAAPGGTNSVGSPRPLPWASFPRGQQEDQPHGWIGGAPRQTTTLASNLWQSGAPFFGRPALRFLPAVHKQVPMGSFAGEPSTSITCGATISSRTRPPLWSGHSQRGPVCTAGRKRSAGRPKNGAPEFQRVRSSVVVCRGASPIHQWG